MLCLFRKGAFSHYRFVSRKPYFRNWQRLKVILSLGCLADGRQEKVCFLILFLSRTSILVWQIWMKWKCPAKNKKTKTKKGKTKNLCTTVSINHYL